jgi:hypothetical protein
MNYYQAPAGKKVVGFSLTQTAKHFFRYRYACGHRGRHRVVDRLGNMQVLTRVFAAF